MSLDSNYEAKLKPKSASAEKCTPSREIYNDRFIPCRHNRDIQISYQLHSLSNSDQKNSKEENNYIMALKSEVIGSESAQQEPAPKTDTKTQKNFFSYKSPTKSLPKDSGCDLSPMSNDTYKLLTSFRKPLRKISKLPYKVLEVPRIQDDYYLNLVDWSSQNLIAVGMANSVYIWNATTSQVTRLCDFDSDLVTSVNWNKANQLAVGNEKGVVEIWDVTRTTKIREVTGHKSRVGALAWNSHVLTSGGRDHMIYHHDIRDHNQMTNKLIGHKQEICGLKWSPDGLLLASGGNDNNLMIWDSSYFSADTIPLQRYSEHMAAVKAIAWSPHQRGLLASGGGTADKCIRFWNTAQNTQQNYVDTGSQVCNLAWSKTVNEIVSTHGFSQNQIVIWNQTTMTPLATLTGHTMRVLYLAMSPDGQTIVTGAGDETLRFWNVFPGTQDMISSSGKHSPLTKKIDIR